MRNHQNNSFSEQLRDVQIPCDLKSRLLSIPEQEDSSIANIRQRTSQAALVIAAILFFAFCSLWARAETTSSEDLLAQVAQLQESLDQVETQRLYHQLDFNQSKDSLIDEPFELESTEYFSIVASIACQHSLELGASYEKIEPDLHAIVKSYPNTIGAGIARSNIRQVSE